ncbi:MAG: phosphoglucomutase/phosphomannomutase family protein, partial [Candidatus Polarisedimenticolia bacterium]
MIHFGTSGWRARIAEEFTFANVRRAVTAIAAWLHETGAARRGVYVGYDTRFLSERFAAIAASTLADHRVPAVLSPTPVPTPAVAWAIVSGRRAGGVNITASHNPPAWNGLKFSTHRGAPAPPGITRRIEELAAHPAGPGAVPADASAGGPARRSAVRTHDIRQAYFKQLSGLVRLRAIRRARLRIACDLRHGASIGFLDGILRHATSSLKPIHDRPHPEFGGL